MLLTSPASFRRIEGGFHDIVDKGLVRFIPLRRPAPGLDHKYDRSHFSIKREGC
jgi:hypothetical protein